MQILMCGLRWKGKEVPFLIVFISSVKSGARLLAAVRTAKEVGGFQREAGIEQLSRRDSSWTGDMADCQVAWRGPLEVSQDD